MCGRCERDVFGLGTCTPGGQASGDERGMKGTDGLVIYDVLRAELIYARSGWYPHRGSVSRSYAT